MPSPPPARREIASAPVSPELSLGQIMQSRSNPDTRFAAQHRHPAVSPDVAPDGPTSDSDPLGESDPRVAYWRAPELFLLDAVLTLVGVMEAAETRPRVFVCDLRAVPVLDARACRVISVLLGRCRRTRMALILSGVGPTALRTLGAAGTLYDLGAQNVFAHLSDAMSRARILMNED